VEEAVSETRRSGISYSGRFPTLREAEEFLIAEALKKSGGNQSLAARLLGINQSTLSRRQKKGAVS
jgi:transcriptional regulator with PAS, ATPase and Fis domain